MANISLRRINTLVICRDKAHRKLKNDGQKIPVTVNNLKKKSATSSLTQTEAEPIVSQFITMIDKKNI